MVASPPLDQQHRHCQQQDDSPPRAASEASSGCNSSATSSTRNTSPDSHLAASPGALPGAVRVQQHHARRQLPAYIPADASRVVRVPMLQNTTGASDARGPVLEPVAKVDGGGLMSHREKNQTSSEMHVLSGVPSSGLRSYLGDKRRDAEALMPSAGLVTMAGGLVVGMDGYGLGIDKKEQRGPLQLGPPLSFNRNDTSYSTWSKPVAFPSSAVASEDLNSITPTHAASTRGPMKPGASRSHRRWTNNASSSIRPSATATVPQGRQSPLSQGLAGILNVSGPHDSPVLHFRGFGSSSGQTLTTTTAPNSGREQQRNPRFGLFSGDGANNDHGGGTTTDASQAANANGPPPSAPSPHPVHGANVALPPNIYAYAFDRGNGFVTRLVPVDMLPTLEGVPRYEPRENMMILPIPSALAPNGRSTNHEGVGFQNRIDTIIASSSGNPHAHHAKGKQANKQDKVYCDKWVHDGTCAFAQQGCKYLHDMPMDKATQVTLGLYTGLPNWYKKYQQELARQQDLAELDDNRDVTSRDVARRDVANPEVANRGMATSQNPNTVITSSEPFFSGGSLQAGFLDNGPGPDDFQPGPLASAFHATPQSVNLSPNRGSGSVMLYSGNKSSDAGEKSPPAPCGRNENSGGNSGRAVSSSNWRATANPLPQGQGV